MTSTQRYGPLVSVPIFIAPNSMTDFWTYYWLYN